MSLAADGRAADHALGDRTGVGSDGASTTNAGLTGVAIFVGLTNRLAASARRRDTDLIVVAVVIDLAGHRNAEMPLTGVTCSALNVTFAFTIFTTELAINTAVASLRLLNFVDGDTDIFTRRINWLIGTAREHETKAG